MGTNNIEVKILTKDGIRFNGSASSITLPSITGQITILPKHIPLLSGLKSGTITVTQGGQNTEKVVITSGFLRFINNTCTVTIEEKKLKSAS